MTERCDFERCEFTEHLVVKVPSSVDEFCLNNNLLPVYTNICILK